MASQAIPEIPTEAIPGYSLGRPEVPSAPITLAELELLKGSVMFTDEDASAATGEPDADYDQAWLDYQFEIGVRHHRIGKNRTDGVDSVPIIRFRYLPTLHFAITATLEPFLEKRAESPEDVKKMLDAWRKSTLLQVILWSYPYIQEGDL